PRLVPSRPLSPYTTLFRSPGRFFRKRRAAQRGTRMTPAGEKAAARLAVRQACAAVPAGVHAAASGSLCRALAALPQFAAAHTVAAFFGMGAEPDTRAFLHEVLA